MSHNHRTRWMKTRWVVLTLIGLGAVPVVAMTLHSPSPSEAIPAAETAPEQEPVETDVVSVKTVRPKPDPSFELSVEEPAYVEAYYRADLLARVAGSVKAVQKDIGDPIKEGECLLEIDVPDMVQELAQKQAIIEQRQQELELAKVNV